MPVQCACERRTSTLTKVGKRADWDVGGKLQLPLHTRRNSKVTLAFTCWDRDMTAKTADMFIGTHAQLLF